MSGGRPPASERRRFAGESDWLRPGQAAEFLGVAHSTIRAWSDQGRLPVFYTPGGHRRYRRRDLVRVGLELEREREGGPAREAESPG